MINHSYSPCFRRQMILSSPIVSAGVQLHGKDLVGFLIWFDVGHHPSQTGKGWLWPISNQVWNGISLSRVENTQPDTTSYTIDLGQVWNIQHKTCSSQSHHPCSHRCRHYDQPNHIQSSVKLELPMNQPASFHEFILLLGTSLVHPSRFWTTELGSEARAPGHNSIYSSRSVPTWQQSANSELGKVVLWSFFFCGS